MIDFQQVSKNYGGQDVLVDVSFRINDNEHVGIVGPNGAGKSTIFSIITGDVQQDKGEVLVQRGLTIGYVRQQLNPHSVECSILEYAENAMGEVQQMQREIDAITHALPDSEPEQQSKDLHRLGELQAAFEHSGGYDLCHRAEAALCGLGFSAEALTRPFRTFSGGWQMRAELARTLVARPGILLLDEPSNYLDLPAIEWLQRYLHEFPGTLALISHDRYLLNSLTTVTLEVSRGNVTRYPGPCDYYLRERVRRYEHHLATKRVQDRKREHVERFIERFRAKNTKASQVQSRIAMLDKMEEVAAPEPIHFEGRIRIAAPPHSGIEVIRLEDAGVTYDGSTWVLRHVDLSVARGEKIALVGLNGMGKTTLLRAIAGVMPLNEGTRALGHKVVIGYQAQDYAENMPPDQTAFAIVKAMAPNTPEQRIRSLMGSFGFSGESIEKRCDILSGGEKLRLAFARLLVNPPNFLVLDEPTTHLDMAGCEMLQAARTDYQGTLCFVSHDVEFVRHVATQIIAMTPPGITRYVGGYDYYREKSAAMAAASTAAASVTQKAEPQRKVEKRERAQRVRDLAKQRRPLETKIATAEKTLDALHAEQTQLLATLSSAGQGADFARTNQRLTAIQQEIAAATEQWETAAALLEQIAQA